MAHDEGKEVFLLDDFNRDLLNAQFKINGLTIKIHLDKRNTLKNPHVLYQMPAQHSWIMSILISLSIFSFQMSPKLV